MVEIPRCSAAGYLTLFYAAFNYPIGILGDRLGLRKVLLSGLPVFALVYLGMAWNRNLYFFFILFFGYGLYAAATEGIAKAWISNVTDK